MSKQYLSKRCAYCGKPAETGDHIFARAFFLPSERANLPKIAACRGCNSKKSALEHELSAVMPFGGRHDRSLETLTALVPPRLARNRVLHKRLQTEKSYAWIAQPSGLIQKCMTLPFSGDKLVELFGYIVRGVHAYHFEVTLKPETEVTILPLVTPALKSAFMAMLQWNAQTRVHENIGGGTFEYEGLLGIDNTQISVWAFEMFGGMQVAQTQSGAAQRLILGAIVGPKTNARNADPEFSKPARE